MSGPSDWPKRKWNHKIPMILVALILFASTRQWLDTRDTDLYLELFRSLSSYSGQIEPAFALLIYLVRFLGGGEFAFLLLCASIGVTLKLYAINSYAKSVGLSVFFYVLKFYPLHEMVQIRAGIAVGIALLGIRYIIRERFLYYVTTILIAMSFHYSTIVFILLYPAIKIKISNKGLIFAGSTVLILLSLLNIDRRIINVLSEYFPRVELYLQLLTIGEYSRINIFNPEFMLKVGMFLAICWGRETRRLGDPYIEIWQKMLLLDIVFFVVLRSVPVVAFRVSELFNVAMIFAYPTIISSIRDWRIKASVVMALFVFYAIVAYPLQGRF